MKSRWSPDSSTKLTTAEQPAVSAASAARRGSSSRIATSAARSWSRYPVRPSSGKTTSPAPAGRRLAEELGVAGEVRLEVPEAGGDLGEGDPKRLHARESSRCRARIEPGRRRAACCREG